MLFQKEFESVLSCFYVCIQFKIFSMAARFFCVNCALLKFHDLQHTLVISGNHEVRPTHFYFLYGEAKFRTPLSKVQECKCLYPRWEAK